MKMDVNGSFFAKMMCAALVLFAAWPEPLFAQNLQASTKALLEGLQDVPTIISGISYLAGGVMVLGGANKLKMHAENPTQTPISHGLVRIGVGGVIAGLPPFMAWVNNSMGVGDGQLGFKRMQKISDNLIDAFGGTVLLG